LHHKLETTNEMLMQNGVERGKTGFTFEARECFMAIQEKSEGEYIVHVVLGAENRFQDMTKIIEFLDEKYLNIN
jgi:D-alanyl-D-alanine carboxypeptidase